MIVFPNAKINIGLFVTQKREDGFHNIESVFYPVKLSDILEMRIKNKTQTKLFLAGKGENLHVDNDNNNTVLRAFKLLKRDFPQIQEAEISLYKNIPVFAGLGGGSSDATYMIKLINQMYDLQLSEEQLHFYAVQIGFDCSFFIENRPQFVYSRGEKTSVMDLNLKGFYLILAKPNINISTREAYNDVHITESPFDLRKLDVSDINNWKEYVRNDFEVRLFDKYPILGHIKQTMYGNGAVYAQMSGSGSTIFGIFDKKIDTDKLKLPDNTFVYSEEL